MIKRLHLTWLVLAAGAALAVLTIQEYAAQWVGTGSFLGHYSPKLVAIMALVGLSGLIALAGLALSFTRGWPRLIAVLETLAKKLSRWGAALPILGGLLLLGWAAILLIRPLNTIVFGGAYTRLWVTWLLSLVLVLLARAWRREWNPLAVFCGAFLATGVIFLLLNYRNDLSTSPLTLAWSEGSRYYNASLWFSSLVYGQALPLPELHPTRYLLQGLAFLLPGATIAFHRAWQVFLWIACNGLAVWALVRRLKTPRSRLAPVLILFGLWAFLTFYQGPIYYHLILCAFAVLIGFDRAHFWRSLAVVGLASVWAGLSRINWYPVPGLLAVALYLLEEPLGGRKLWRYLAAPAAWAAAGVALAFIANAIYVKVSGNPPEVFGSALNSPLLFYRLKPNPTFGPGVLIASLVFVPVALASAWNILRAPRAWHWIRLAGLVGILGVFYASGLVVSLKVGGGSNLHNLDNFILFLVVICGYIFFNRFAPDGEAAPWRIPAWAMLALLVFPIFSADAGLNLAAPVTPKMTSAQAVAWLQGMVDRYATDGRPVLLISERQLVTFDQLKVPSFEPSYEKVFLMEMAMARNPYYLGQYVSDLKARKFSLIISEPMNSNIQDGVSFAEENNLWVEGVEQPTLIRYQLAGKLDDQGYPIAVYIPK